jgi:UPF0755 protein
VKLLRRLFVLLLLALLAGAAYVLYVLNRPYAGFEQEAFVELPRGTGTRQIADKLREAGVIRETWPFLLARALHPRRALQAGDYQFTRPASVLNVFDRIARGDIFLYELVVPEGRNLFEIGAAAEKVGVFKAEEFVRAARNPALIRDLAPQAPSLEGYLFPDTYKLRRRTTPELLCRIMTGKFREVWRGLGTQADVHQTVTLASLVEKEGKLPEERPIIASVFLRRLQMGMRLDADPTTIYAALLEGRYRGTIYKSDLQSPHPYNTYRRTGLPPGPIANPGLASLRAVLNPAETDYLFFVLRPDGSGGHAFSSDLDAHQQAIAKYRQGISARPAP